ncbi:MAG: phosphoribosylformylglycinamidine synthase subunit PurL [Spirochaetes bacterium]|nr:phosphoribosylformylglycinamidine synthase subunit PurL [Spirochaetota bacterium]
MKVETIDIHNLSDSQLVKLSRDRVLSLNLDEMKSIKKYYNQEKRSPTDMELEILAQTWSEHCKHKVFNSNIELRKDKTRKVYNNLFKETIVKATKKYLESSNNICVSVFKDNAGIIKFNRNYHLAFKVETHNHPSALDPFGGANTGVGGVIRDILGTGLGAFPVASLDVLCFGFPDFPYEQLPPGVLHPKRLYSGVIQGIKDYGNKIGIPTVNGSIHFDNRYIGNPLVFVGTAGIIPPDKYKKKARSGDLIVVIGGKTGRDGIHGATFSSAHLDSQSEETSAAAVQIGDPITEKKFMDVLIKARDRDLYHNITDCGAGGFSSAVGEMASSLGAEVYLERVPLKHQNMRPWEIFLSESQERMVLAVPEDKVKPLIRLFSEEDVEATIIGKFTKTGRLKVFFNDQNCGDLDLHFLHDGLPQSKRQAVWTTKKVKESVLKDQKDYTDDLFQLLSSYEISSKESVIREYDFEVKGGTFVKPLQGKNQGPGDATVIVPDLSTPEKGMVIAHGINIRQGDADPYRMACSSIDEALRNAVCVGADIDDCALLDNFCWGNPDNKRHLAALALAAQACHDASVQWKIPFVSGKDSFYNEFSFKDDHKNRVMSVPYTLLITVFGTIQMKYTVSMDCKKPGGLIYIIGLTKNEPGGGSFLALKNKVSNRIPDINFKMARNIFKKIHEAITRSLIISAHDISDGGLAVALAEMSLASGLGFDGSLGNVPVQGIKKDHEILFSESNTRFLVEVPFEKQKEFESFFRDIPNGPVGTINDSDEFVLKNKKGDACIKTKVKDLLYYWRNPGMKKL